MEYDHIMGHFKKALNYSLEDNDQGELDDMILAYIANKEAKREAEAITEDNQIPNNVVKLSGGRVYDVDNVRDPLTHRGKGRPPTKRLKPSNKEKNKVSVRKMKNVNVSCEKEEFEV